MKTATAQFNYYALTFYHGEVVFIWNPNEFLISLLLTLGYMGLKWESRQLRGFVSLDGQEFGLPLTDK